MAKEEPSEQSVGGERKKMIHETESWEGFVTEERKILWQRPPTSGQRKSVKPLIFISAGNSSSEKGPSTHGRRHGVL